MLGTLGGAMAGYLFSNKKLREELSNAKDAETAAKLLGEHLKRDGKKLGKQVKDFVESDDVQKNLSKAKKYANAKVNQASKELKGFIKKGAGKAKTAAKKAVKKAR